MRRPFPQRLEHHRLADPVSPSGQYNGAYGFSICSVQVLVIASDGGGWDHVSVSTPERVPTWEEMCKIKSLFFDDEEVVMQLHPAKSQYVNYHERCLHLWRPQTQSEIDQIAAEWGREWAEAGYAGLQSPGAIPTPPTLFVGPK